MYLVNYDTDGKILGFYMKGMHTNIPEPTLEITDAQHQNYFEKGQKYKVVDDIFVHAEPEAQAPQVITPPVDQDTADMWEALFALSAELDALKGGN